REREPAVHDSITGRRNRRRGRMLAEAVPDQTLIREDRRGVVEPDFALDERADRVRWPAELEQRLPAHRGCVALHRHGHRLLQLREHVERGLWLSIAELEACALHRDRLLLVAVRAVLRVV